jgi:hypothetical protein
MRASLLDSPFSHLTWIRSSTSIRFLVAVMALFWLGACGDGGSSGGSDTGDSIASAQTITRECGGELDLMCDEGELCVIEQGVCDEFAKGACVVELDVCPGVFNPVCGCDGKTYDSRCLALQSGATVESDGECDDITLVCGGESDLMCEMGELCRIQEGVCDEFAEGICVVELDVCPDVINLVCGCDGRNYLNRCWALRLGATIESEGACTSDAVKVCHVPPGNPGNRHTIHISESAVDTHLKRHDDYLGECDRPDPRR